jgi:hypothetical protein
MSQGKPICVSDDPLHHSYTCKFAKVLCKQASIHFQFEEDTLCFTNTQEFDKKHKYDLPKSTCLLIHGITFQRSLE